MDDPGGGGEKAGGVDPCALVEAALLAYLRVHGRRILEISAPSGQTEVKIALRALFRYFSPSGRYRRLLDALEDCAEPPLRLVDDGEPSLVVPLDFVRRVVGWEGARA